MSGEIAAKNAIIKDSNRKTLEQIFNDPLSIDLERSQMHQAFQIPYAGTDSTLSSARTSGLKLRYHPGYGLVGLHKGKYFISPSANVIVGHE